MLDCTFLLFATKFAIANNKTEFVNLFLFIFSQMGYNLFKRLGLSPLPHHLRACMKLANPVKNIPSAVNNLIISFIWLFFLFFFPICLSPPYILYYIIGFTICQLFLCGKVKKIQSHWQHMRQPAATSLIMRIHCCRVHRMITDKTRAPISRQALFVLIHFFLNYSI